MILWFPIMFRVLMMENGKMDKKKILYNIVSLRYDLDNYRQARQFGKVAEIRLEIARLQSLLTNTK